ncbi:unnamed protein product [Polarella glacialis]|uniref:Uncharacterized protein n=1 Tax=Polarella glacialis TaxID=89957 RepID=A0A813GZK5_POLGL|nr:unnamed protein product [Polarella glacialis]
MFSMFSTFCCSCGQGGEALLPLPDSMVVAARRPQDEPDAPSDDGEEEALPVELKMVFASSAADNEGDLPMGMSVAAASHVQEEDESVDTYQLPEAATATIVEPELLVEPADDDQSGWELILEFHSEGEAMPSEPEMAIAAAPPVKEEQKVVVTDKFPKAATATIVEPEPVGKRRDGGQAGLVLTFELPDQTMRDITFATRPLGIDFKSGLPLTVVKVKPECPGLPKDILPGWELKYLGGKLVPDTYKRVLEQLKAHVSLLPAK